MLMRFRLNENNENHLAIKRYLDTKSNASDYIRCLILREINGSPTLKPTKLDAPYKEENKNDDDLDFSGFLA